MVLRVQVQIAEVLLFPMQTKTRTIYERIRTSEVFE